MSGALPPSIAVVLPPREGFGPRRARGIGLTVRQQTLVTYRHRPVVFGGKQHGPVFLDVTFRLVSAPFYIPGPTRGRYLLGLLRPLRTLRPVLIEVHADPLIALRLQRAFPKIPVVLVAHEEPSANRMTRIPSRRAILFQRIARVVTVSEWLRDQFLDGMTPPPARPPLVVPPAVDLARLAPTTGMATAGVGSQATRRSRVILFVGRLAKEKGADLFVSACTSALPALPGWRAEIIGAAEHTVKSGETQFVRLLRASAEPASISMMGYRDHPDVLAAMARAAIVVVPSRAPEAGGRVVLEAMANGAAVICSPGGAGAEVGGDAVIQAGADDLAAAIRDLGSDPRRIAELGEAGRKRAAQYDLRHIGRLVDEIRARIITEGPPRP